MILLQEKQVSVFSVNSRKVNKNIIFIKLDYVCVDWKSTFISSNMLLIRFWTSDVLTYPHIHDFLYQKYGTTNRKPWSDINLCLCYERLQQKQTNKQTKNNYTGKCRFSCKIRRGWRRGVGRGHWREFFCLFHHL